jgi:hypothetical protein
VFKLSSPRYLIYIYANIVKAGKKNPKSEILLVVRTNNLWDIFSGGMRFQSTAVRSEKRD